MALATGCDPDPLWLDCPLSESIQAACASEAESTSFTCVVEKHPFCLQEVCASWEGQTSVCTQRCTIDADCPSGSQCKVHLDLQFCVQDKYLTGTSATTPAASADAVGSAD
jgi:hypothetical protein